MLTAPTREPVTDFESALTPVLIRLLEVGWLSFGVAAPRLSPATTWGKQVPSPANFIDANRPRGLTPDKLLCVEGRSRAGGWLMMVESTTPTQAMSEEQFSAMLAKLKEDTGATGEAQGSYRP